MIRLALDRPISTLVGVAALSALGALSLWQLPVALLPDVDRPAIVVVATAPDRSRDEILHGITDPFERRLMGVPGLARLTSETEDGRVRLILAPDWQVDAGALLIEISRRLDAAAAIPAAVEVTLAGSEASPVVEVAIRGGESAGWRSAFARDVVRPELARLPDAGRVEVVGLSPRTLVVTPRAADLAARNLTAADVAARLETIGRVEGAGLVSDGASQRPLVVHEAVRSLEDLARIDVGGPRGASPLHDVASAAVEEVADGSVACVDGDEATLVAVWRAPGANAVGLARGVHARIRSLEGSRRDAARVEVVSDSSDEVVAALSELAVAALVGLLLGTLVLRWMLGRWAPTFALCVVIPTSLLCAFAAFRMFGIPLDVVSLSGLALAAGMLVDNSIVVLEAIESARSRGEREPALAGTRQVALAVVASCATALIVFLPLLYLRGLARAFFGEQAFAVTTSLSASLLLALTLTPVLASGSAVAGRTSSPGLAIARRMLEAALGHPRIALLLGAVVTACTFIALLGMPRELFPQGSPKRLRVAYELPPDLSRSAARERGLDLAMVVTRAARSAEPAASVVAVQGLDDGTGDTRFTVGRLDVACPDAEAAGRVRAAIERALAGMTSVRARVDWKRSAFVASLTRGGTALEVVVASPDETRLPALAADASRAAGEMGVRLERAITRLPEAALLASWDEPRLVRLGASRDEIERAVHAGLGGLELGRVEIAGLEPAIRLAATQPGRLELIPVRVPMGDEGIVSRANGDSTSRVVPAGALLSASPQPREPLILRDGGRRALRLVATDAVRDPEAIARSLRRLRVEPGEVVSLAGSALELQRAFAQLRFVAILSLVLCFLAVAVAYESLLLPLLNMSAVPVAFGGGLVLLALTGQSLNVMSFIGLIVLGGLVTNHAVVLVDRIEQLRVAGTDEEQSLRQAVAERYRPVIMTTLTTMLGMLPLALLGGEGQELRRALATAVLGGLATATLATLVLTPILHRALEPWRRRRT